MASQYKIGSLLISLEGKGAIYKLIASELSSIGVNENRTPDIRFTFVDRHLPSDFKYSGSTMFNKDKVRFEESGFVFEINRSTESIDVQIVEPTLRTKTFLMRQLLRFFNWGYLYAEEEHAKNFFYNIFDWITQIQNLSVNQTYIHASTLEKNGEGLAIMGWGGVGKTTSMLKMVTEGGWRYLSDDIGAIDSNGYIYRTPKHIQIYAYNTKNEPTLYKRLMERRSILDKLSWHLRLYRKGSAKVRRRTSPTDLFSKQALSDKSKLKNVVFLEPTSYDSWESKKVNATEIASLMAPIVMQEIEPFTRIAREAAVATTYDLPSILEVEKQTEKSIETGLRGANCYLARIPKNLNPDQLIKFIDELIK